MTPDAPPGNLDAETRQRAQDLLYESLAHRSDNRLLTIGVVVAVVLHAIVLVINFPDVEQTIVPEPTKPVIIVRKYVPPPPKFEQRQVVRQAIGKKIPLPDPTPDEPEPIREPEPEIVAESLPSDLAFEIGIPDGIGPPPSAGPMAAGVGGVTHPVRIVGPDDQPVFPETARLARLSGQVTVQATIRKDGTVGDVEVLACSRPGVNFEQSAVLAVKKWRYTPGVYQGKPVDVFLTVIVTFELN